MIDRTLQDGTFKKDHFSHIFPSYTAGTLEEIEMSTAKIRKIREGFFEEGLQLTPKARELYRLLGDAGELLWVALQFYRPTGDMSFWFSRELEPEKCQEVIGLDSAWGEKLHHFLLHKYEVEHSEKDSTRPSLKYYEAVGGDNYDLMDTAQAKVEREYMDLGQRILAKVSSVLSEAASK